MKWIFQSERLLFRKFTEDDAGLLITLNSDPAVTRYVHEAPTTAANATSILQDVIIPQYGLKLGRWAVHLKYTYEFIGWAGLKYLPSTGVVDLGYRFMTPFWGKGYATEAAKTCISYGFTHLQLDRIIAQAHIDNTASLKVIQKCGMKFMREDFVDGQPVKVYEIVNKK